jgi:YesN/AraC family two-component response regulator
MHKLYIKNMVCNRCIMMVESELKKTGLHILNVELGEVDLEDKPTKEHLQKLDQQFASLGFELIDDKKSRIIEKIKNTVVDYVHHHPDKQHNFSKLLSEKLSHDYTYLSNLFSDIEGITIEKFIIHHKIERVKELIVYDELNLTEIADQMGYSSVAYLSNQFKKVTGLSPSHFKTLKANKRTALDQL